jgi:hypothetical protein
MVTALLLKRSAKYPPGREKTTKGIGEHQGNDKHEKEIPLLARHAGLQPKKTDQPFQGVLAKRTLKLRRNQRPKAQLVAARVLRRRSLNWPTWRMNHEWRQSIVSPGASQARQILSVRE